MILRTTNQATNNANLNYIFSNQIKYNEISQQIASQKKILVPSDNAIDSMNILNINRQMSKLNGYLNNMSMAQNELSVLDNSLASITSSLQKANDLAVQAASETNGTNNLQSMKVEIDQIIENVISLGNTKYNGQYIFAGTNTGTTPFQAVSTGGVEYTGTPQDGPYQRNIEISDGVLAPINVPGDRLLGSYDAATETGTGVLKTLYQLSDAMGAVPPDFDTIRASLDEIQGGITSTTNIRTNFAAMTARFKMTETSVNNSLLQLTSYKSQMQDLDLAAAATNLANTELALNASMAVASNVIQQLSLLDYM
ncbi:MAG TPA: flagellar hook-associated protein FlgL [Candidatus Gastranaerophilaceae bacterium]|nr:flagellar hook-associated protein FlgL [Candidatus Gastranaerophilaceae bacterium]HPT41911.1 flagellar hook-associated protein FlgL [Candidatus Gastranaerophilaceae bacterium]